MDMEYRQIAVGKIQVWAEATLTGKAITEADLRGWLLPLCAKADLNAATFEYLAAYLTKKLELK